MWVLLAIGLTGVFIAGLPAGYAEWSSVCSDPPCSFLVPTETELASLSSLGLGRGFWPGLGTALELLIAVAWGGTAVLIFARRSTDRLGLLGSFTLLLFGVNTLSDGVTALEHVYPTVARLSPLRDGLGIASFVLLLFVFPTGRFVPGWTRFAAAAVVVLTSLGVVLPLLAAGPDQTALNDALAIVDLMFIALALVAQLRRYQRYATPVERQQTKWVLFGLGCVVLAALGYTVIFELSLVPAGQASLLARVVAIPLLGLALCAFPVSMTFSILRYRLFDIDLIIKRTLTYGALTISIAITYLVAVLSLQSAFRALTGQSNQLAIVASTLLIASLFNPLRRRIQSAVSRRFYRGDYDAALTLNAFGESVRNEVDLASMQSELLDTVQQTMHPNYVSLWLRRDAGNLARDQ